MNINEAFPSRFLKATDLHGRAVKVVVDRVSIEEVGGEDKAVLHFVGKNKSLVLNKINANIIADAHGPETDTWTDAELELYPDKTNFQGRLVDCLRVRISTPVVDADEPAPF